VNAKGVATPGLSTPKFRREVLAFVLEKRWRGEEGIIRHFTKMGRTGPRSWARRCSRAMVEDALFDLVLRKKLEWFGAEDDGSKPMRYRARAAKKGQ
jgi:hypothetical protein